MKQHYRVGRVFACPDYASSRGYYYCMVSTFSDHACKGTVTFMRPFDGSKDCFACFPKNYTRETVEFDGYRNALIPVTYTCAVSARRVRVLLPLSSQIRVYLKYAAGENHPATKLRQASDLLILCKAAYAMQ